MGLARLLVLASVMLVATVVASSLPQWIRFSPRRLHQLSVYSTGLLIGAALTIVIPEGVAAVYANSSSLDHDAQHESAQGSPYRHDAHSNPTSIGLALLAGFLLMYLIDTYTHSHPPASSVGRLDRSDSRHRHRYLTRQSSSISELEPLNANSSHHHHHYRNGSDEYDWAENGNLGTANSDRKSLAPTSSSSINGGTSANPSRSSSPTHHHPPSPPNEPTPSSSPSSSASAISTVIGLVVHSLADGVSLGASSLPSGEQAVTQFAPSSTSLELIIFLAIMVHKAPAAFALSSLLSSNRSVSPSFLRKSLLAFSLAAPLGALTTYGLLTLVGVELEGGQDGIGWWTGLALVFSGGTFLFVATHVIKENAGTEGGSSTHGRSSESVEDGQENDKGGGPVWVVAGMLTPWVLGRLVGHGH